MRIKCWTKSLQIYKAIKIYNLHTNDIKLLNIMKKQNKKKLKKWIIDEEQDSIMDSIRL